MTLALKSIEYRGGVVKFRIPADWVENYEPEGGGEFFEDGHDTPTLRLNVLTMQGPAATSETAADALKKYGPVERRNDGTALVRYSKQVDEEGTPIRIRYWQIAQPLPPRHLRILVFSLTSLESEEDAPALKATLALLESEIAAAELAPILGLDSTSA
jgi:hypothetical protein